MPIRTNRGRAAVYRKVWGWPLRSPRHLIGTVLVVAIVAVGIAIGVTRSRAGSGQPEHNLSGPVSAPSTVVVPTSVPASELPNRITSVPPPSSAPPAPAALALATKWTQAWAHHPQGITNRQWVAGLRPYTTPDFLPELSSVDPANVPATRVTGKPRPIRSFAASVTATVPTDGGPIRVTVIKTGQGWRVSDYGKG